jgi:hypothetical protein
MGPAGPQGTTTLSGDSFDMLLEAALARRASEYASVGEQMFDLMFERAMARYNSRRSANGRTTR